MYILIALCLVPGAGGIFPSEIIKNVSSLSGNFLNDLRYYVNKTLSVKPVSSTWITSHGFYYYLLARNCTVCRDSCHDYSSSGLSHAFRSVVKKTKMIFTSLGRSVLEKLCPLSRVPKYLGYPRPWAQFCQYGPPGWWITYIYYFTCHVLKNVVRVIEGKIVYKITRREMKIGSSYRGFELLRVKLQ